MEAELSQAKLKAEALTIESQAEIEALKQSNEAEIAHTKVKIL